MTKHSTSSKPEADDLDLTDAEKKLVRQIRTHRPAPLSDAKVSRIEQRALSRFKQHRQSPARPLWQFGLQVVFAFAVVAALIVLSSGVVAASTASLPGESLYPIKRFSETVQLTFTPAAERAAFHHGLAETRLNEIEALDAQGIVLPEILADMSNETEQALTEAKALPTEQQTAVLEKLSDLSLRQQAVLDRVQAAAPAQAQAALAHAQEVSQRGHERAQEAILKIKSTPSKPEPVASKTPKPTQATGNAQHTPPGQDKPTAEPKATKTPPGQSGGNSNSGGNGNDGGNGNGSGGGKP